ncbi:MAG: ABC transporter permease subunit [Candidatus Gracilibacteria bacterium]|nr:ABC transporter permease subunit [Candidatus Gracilibacteria bacterium]
MLKNKSNYISIGVIFIFFIIWQLLGTYGIVSTVLISSPEFVFNRLMEMLGDGSLVENLQFSISNLTIGLIISILSGIILGLVFHFSNFLYSFFKPMVFSLNSLPLISLLPLILLWFGFEDFAKILTIVVFCTPTIIINMYNGLKSVNKDLLLVSKAFRLNRIKHIWSILFFGALPYIFTGIKISIGKAIIGLVLSEMFGYGKGIGYLLFLYSSASDTTGLLLITFILLLINYVFIFLLNAIKLNILKKYDYNV